MKFITLTKHSANVLPNTLNIAEINTAITKLDNLKFIIQDAIITGEDAGTIVVDIIPGFNKMFGYNNPDVMQFFGDFDAPHVSQTLIDLLSQYRPLNSTDLDNKQYEVQSIINLLNLMA